MNVILPFAGICFRSYTNYFSGNAVNRDFKIDRSVDLTKQTAHNTYSSVSAAPIICLFSALAAAAAAFAAVPTFDGGSIMPQDNMATLHKNEMTGEPSRQRSDLSLQSKPQRA